MTKSALTLAAAVAACCGWLRAAEALPTGQDSCLRWPCHGADHATPGVYALTVGGGRGYHRSVARCVATLRGLAETRGGPRR